MKSSGWRWHLDEMFVKINGERHYLWRAVDQEGEVLESFVTKTRDKKAALKFLKKTMRKHGQQNVIVTDRLRSYGAALKESGTAHRQETGRWLNNRAENSHLPFRRRERAMLRFRRGEGCRRSQPFTPQFTTCSIRKEVFTHDPILNSTVPPLLLSGAVSARHNEQYHCPCGDWFELVCLHPSESRKDRR